LQNAGVENSDENITYWLIIQINPIDFGPTFIWPFLIDVRLNWKNCTCAIFTVSQTEEPNAFTGMNQGPVVRVGIPRRYPLDELRQSGIQSFLTSTADGKDQARKKQCANCN